MNYKNFAISLAKEAGAEIRKNFANGLKMSKEWKKDGTPVTKTDIAINKMVIKGVKKFFPKHGVLGEEESYNITNTEYLWVCDPVDGTVPFSHGIPTCVFSLALVKNGQPILGVIFEPFLKRMFFAEKNKGAFLNGKKISVNKLNFPQGVMGFSNLGMTELKTRFPQMPIICLWCICYEGILVASGELTATYYNHYNAHDIAALKVIVEEAGGKVTDRNGNEQRYDGKINGAIISNGVVHNDLIKIINKHYKKAE
jgi:fructose-1,6-bisphosphatase/inositol monophosphatase family enzyme